MRTQEKPKETKAESKAPRSHPKPRTPIPENQARALVELAAKAPKLNRLPLRGQAEAAVILKNRGFGVTDISRFFTEHGLPISASTVCKYFKRLEGGAK
jgi:hypothetical protein